MTISHSTRDVHASAYERPVQRLAQSDEFRLVSFLGLHILLGISATTAPGMISTVHALLTILIGVIVAGSRAPLVRVAHIASYIMGAELFWRMAGANVFWETGKYAIVLVIGIALFRSRSTRIPPVLLFYFLLLAPAAILTLEQFDLNRARQQIAFNLSGPFALFISGWFFSNIKFKRFEFQQLLIGMLAPILSIAAYATLGMLSLGTIEWTTESNLQTSGGFGPNQISMILGLGALATLMLLTLASVKARFMRGMIGLVGIWLIAQALLTLSRGGVLSAVIATAVYTAHIIATPRQRARFIFASIIVIPFIFLFLLPRLDEFTSGYLRLRYQEMDLTNRDVILMTELKVFAENPLFGVGPGVGGKARDAAAHTEYTRMLAEHGIPGLLSLALLGIALARAYLKSRDALSRGIRGGAAIWGLTTMTHAAMRIAAMPFMLALSFAEFDLDE